MCGSMLWNEVKKEELRKRAQVEKLLSGRVDHCVLRLFRQVERIDERMAKKVMNSDVVGNRCRGRPRLSWIDGVKGALREGCQWSRVANALDRIRWESIVKVSSIKTWSVCMCLHCGGVYTHLHGVGWVLPVM